MLKFVMAMQFNFLGRVTSEDWAFSSCDMHQALGTAQLAEAEAERVRLEEHQVVIADVVRGEVCDEWRLVIDRMAEEHEVRCTCTDDSRDHLHSEFSD